MELDRLAAALVEYETLTKEEIELVIRGEELQRPSIPVVHPNQRKKEEEKEKDLVMEELEVIEPAE